MVVVGVGAEPSDSRCSLLLRALGPRWAEGRPTRQSFVRIGFRQRLSRQVIGPDERLREGDFARGCEGLRGSAWLCGVRRFSTVSGADADRELACRVRAETVAGLGLLSGRFLARAKDCAHFCVPSPRPGTVLGDILGSIDGCSRTGLISRGERGVQRGLI